MMTATRPGSSELLEPDGVISGGGGRSEVVALLPRGTVTLDRETEAALVRAFGIVGEFEARRC